MASRSCQLSSQASLRTGSPSEGSIHTPFSFLLTPSRVCSGYIGTQYAFSAMICCALLYRVSCCFRSVVAAAASNVLSSSGFLIRDMFANGLSYVSVLETMYMHIGVGQFQYVGWASKSAGMLASSLFSACG